MKVLHLLSSNTFSGAENVVFQIIMSTQSIDSLYCSVTGPIKNDLLTNKINHILIEKLTLNNVSKIIKDVKPDLVHAHDVRATAIAVLASKKAPVISHMHVNDESMRIVSRKSLIFLLISFKLKHVFWVSESSFKKYFFRNVVKRKSSVLINVMDKQWIIDKKNSDLDNYQFDLCFVGRLVYQKDPLKFIDIIKLVTDRIPTLQVGIVGDGELRKEIEDKILELSLKSNVKLFGYNPNPLKIISESKILVMTSRFEGTPMVALEALALGTPIIATPTDGLMNLVEEGFNGYLQSDNRDISDKIIKILTNNSLYNELSQNSISKFDQINNVQNYANLIVKEYLEAIK
ncbi:glycosyltransferase [Acholeplasma manati]|uniref:Glycosyltransferase n=1 Tax=Paracholeplasma manati TaxID=591373 RepID=A0ABT2Y670_9MOLU|nr:glycosyltransferase [Paracholeplasma manati]MCV2231495.1 glycosyltransferase [Paracholeplasma manati]